MERHLALPGSVPKVGTGGARCFGRLSQAPALLGARRDGRPSFWARGYGARTPVVRYHDATARTGEGVAPSGLVLLPCPDTGAVGLRARTHARTRGLITRAPWLPKGQATDQWTLAAAALTFRTEQ